MHWARVNAHLCVWIPCIKVKVEVAMAQLHDIEAKGDDENGSM
jgi:hypothetical protein